MTGTCGSPPTKSFRSSSSAIVTSDVSIDSAMLFDGNYKQSETEKVTLTCRGFLMIALRGHCFLPIICDMFDKLTIEAML